MGSTYKFNLVSGVKCEIKELTGKHQEILTRQTRGESHADRLNQVLKSIVVRVGSVSNITEEFIENMLSEDRKHILVTARQFSMDFEDSFVFHYDYEHNGRKKTYEVEIPLEDGKFPIKPLDTLVEDYADITKEVSLELPKSGLKVKFSPLTGVGERMASNAKREDRNASLIYTIRKCMYFRDTEKGGVWMKLNPADLNFKDLKVLRDEIFKYEGKVDTEIIFNHPDTDEKINIDVVNTVDFFFPSGSI